MAYKMLDGNGAAVEAMKLARVKVISAYPITPQSSIAEKLSELVASGELDAEYIRVESEHTAMSAATTAQLTGVRAATATSSVGLALMHEVIGLTAGCRVPIVMPVVNRSLVAPWSLWCDHSDAMAERETGWMQFYCQNVQDIIDLMIIAYKVAEHEKVLLPAMVCLDGFFLSHSMQKVKVYDQELVDQFIGEYKLKNTYLDAEDPMFICDLTPPEDFTELKYQQKVAIDNSIDVIAEVQEEFYKTFGRKNSIIEEYKTDDADVVLVTLGSMSGTAKNTVNEMRKKGIKAGVLRIVVYRPFPFELIRKALKDKKVVGVFDRSAGLGGQGGPVWLDVCAALKGLDIDIRDYVGGLGGRDVPETTIEKIFTELLEINEGKRSDHTSWIDVKDNAMDIREVLKVV
jgi:pyruvate ferredoxin oxidoreductase alpha subunit